MYTIDTSSISNSWQDWYPSDTFPDFWPWLSEQITSKPINAIDLVKSELERAPAEILKWCNSQKSLFVPVDPEIVSRAHSIRNAYPKLAKKGRYETDADPYIIAHAEYYNLTVITEEHIRGNRIPVVCRNLGVPCINILGLMRREGIQFFRRP